MINNSINQIKVVWNKCRLLYIFLNLPNFQSLPLLKTRYQFYIEQRRANLHFTYKYRNKHILEKNRFHCKWIRTTKCLSFLNKCFFMKYLLNILVLFLVFYKYYDILKAFLKVKINNTAETTLSYSCYEE